MILCTFEGGWCDDIERAAARMVEVSMTSRSSVCAVINGIPLVTYPNDCRTPKERIENLALAFFDGWLRSQMENDSIQAIDTRFDPRFECQICRINEHRERVLRETLAALASMVLRKLPDDEEIAALASATATILKETEEQRAMVKQIGKLIKP